MLENNEIDWTVISAISSIVLAVLTLAALLITLVTLRITTFPKGKIIFKFEEVNSEPLYRMRFSNERSVPIMVVHKGIYVKTDEMDLVLVGQQSDTKLQWSELEYYNVSENQINNSLINHGYIAGSTVTIYAYFKTGSNKVYKSAMKHVVKNT